MFCSAQGCDEITTAGEETYKRSGETDTRDYTGLVKIFVPSRENGTTL